MQKLKTIGITAIIALGLGFMLGSWVSFQPQVKKATQPIRYVAEDMLKLPKFNKPAIQPTGQMVFLPSPPVTDTVYQSLCDDHSHIKVPNDYPQDILLTRREPVSKEGNQLQFRYYDPHLKSEVINTYDIEPSPWQWDLRLDLHSPLHEINPVIGPRLEFGHENVLLNVRSYYQPFEKNISVMGGVSLKLAGS